MTLIYRVETWLPDERAWLIRGFVSECDDAVAAKEMYEQKGERACVTTLNLDDALERDAICAYLSQHFGRCLRETLPDPELERLRAAAKRVLATFEVGPAPLCIHELREALSGSPPRGRNEAS